MFRALCANQTDCPAHPFALLLLPLLYNRPAGTLCVCRLTCRLEWGGSRLRPEATGFGTVFFAKELLADEGDSLVGKRCLVSGSG